MPRGIVDFLSLCAKTLQSEYFEPIFIITLMTKLDGRHYMVGILKYPLKVHNEQLNLTYYSTQAIMIVTRMLYSTEIVQAMLFNIYQCLISKNYAQISKTILAILTQKPLPSSNFVTC